MGATCCNRAVPRYRERSWESTSLAAMGHECLSDTFFGGLSGFVSCFLYKPEDFHVLGLFFIQDGSQYGKMARRMGRWREAFRRRTGTEECRHHQVAGMQFTVGYGWGMDVLHRGMTWYATWNIYIYIYTQIWTYDMKIHEDPWSQIHQIRCAKFLPCGFLQRLGEVQSHEWSAAGQTCLGSLGRFTGCHDEACHWGHDIHEIHETWTTLVMTTWHYVALCGYGVDDWYDMVWRYDCDDWMWLVSLE